MTPQQLLNAVRLAILAGTRVTVRGKRIAGARLSVDKTRLAVYYAANEHDFTIACKDDGSACTDGVWPGSREWASLEAQV